MSEKIYACLLRFFPAAFRKRYQDESLQLLRDRLNDEKGFLRRLRLGFDLIKDMVGALPQAYRNSYAEVTVTASLAPRFEGVPSFSALPKEPIGRGIVVSAGILALTALATFLYVMDRLVPYPTVEQDAPKSPVEVVLERLRHSTSPDWTIKAGSESIHGLGYGDNTGEELYNIGGNVSTPIPLKTVDAEFPDEARGTMHPGVCLVALIVDAQGNPQNPQVVRSLGMGLDGRALEAVRKYRFKPAMKDGKIPVPVRLTIVVNFRRR